ncbi:metal ABC transporter ATP-binding protein [Vagococcus xieshaowenii]|uniref:Metal ABC transporter ATP-binding protein n=1 Tax=Vagococcus xieshaowenii TaxID=2562451 RepID=A0A4Z0D7I8_9ENTE|nr:metal ABC transporter ATP-binding protein [Vagococcus xieshaowenii]QCA29177.1 metal ABC transporter ATP-binding protein [Vagococcus xieshaowenii]TFZ40845.1 metal ABC transporter ATP-binding protein [Vagococcus xieshaowenii]
MLEIKHLTVAYQGNVILNNLSTNIPLKQTVGIIGPNGSGKSTLLKGILSLIKTESGEVTVNGKSILSKNTQVAYVPQKSEVDITFPITVFETVLMGTYPTLRKWKRAGKREKEIAQNCIERLGLHEFTKRGLNELSGGQLQRVFIARALAQQADILLLDEPFVGIDVVSEQVIINVLNELKKQGKTILMVHHDLTKVEQYFDYVLLINKGIVAQGPVATTFTDETLQQVYGQWMGAIVKGKEGLS